MLYEVVKRLAFPILRGFFRLTAEGTEHVPRHGPLLLAANHSSLLDPPLVGVAAPRELHFLAKAELFKVPLLGSLIRALGARPIRREGADPMALRLALRILEQGHALLVFPEGTRGEEGALRDAKGGVGMLALLGRAPVVPTYIEGSGRALPRGRIVPRPGRIRVRFGPPLRFAPREWEGRKSGYLAVSREIMAAIARLKAGNPAPDAAWTPVWTGASPADGTTVRRGIIRSKS